jgi:anti-sigma B factor antagonist
MTLAVASRNVSGVLVVRLKGRITMGDGSVQIREAIRESIDNGQTRILLDLGDVNYIDSSGLGELVAGYTTAANRGAQLKLLNVDKKVHDLLQLTKLYTVFDIYDNETKALASF